MSVKVLVRAYPDTVLLVDIDTQNLPKHTFKSSYQYVMIFTRKLKPMKEIQRYRPPIGWHCVPWLQEIIDLQIEKKIKTNKQNMTGANRALLLVPVLMSDTTGSK